MLRAAGAGGRAWSRGAAASRPGGMAGRLALGPEETRKSLLAIPPLWAADIFPGRPFSIVGSQGHPLPPQR